MTSTSVESATDTRPFHVEVPEEELADLRLRIAATRWPEEETVADQSQGVQLATMQELARYWGIDYDFRRFEARLNALPQFITRVRPAQLPLHQGPRLRTGDGVAPADLVRARGFAGGSRRVDAGPRRAQLRRHRAGLRRGPGGQPHARRGPRQHHAHLVDEHRDLLRSSLLGEQPRILRRQGRFMPAAASVFPNELYQAPRSWAERAYPNLIYFNEVDKGNHVAAWQEPELFTTDVRAACRSLRTNGDPS